MPVNPTTRPGRRVLASLLLGVLASAPAAAQTPAFTEHDVSFANGNVSLQGTLVLPTAQAPEPAVVFLHGSGPATRAGARPYAEQFARLGIASLIFDKRGSGKSGGSWTTASLDDLAGDALAAVAYLKAQPGIDPHRIGLWGVSQAGWVATRAAAQSQDIGFMILISGGGATPRESELYSWRQAFDQAGLADTQKAKALDVLDAYFRYLATGAGRPQLATRLDDLAADHSNPLAQLGERLNQVLPSAGNQQNWSWVATYDPAPDIAKVTCPLLLMFGDRDTEHPTPLAVRKWRDGLAAAGNDRATLMVFPGAGHGIRMRDGFTGSGRPPFADGYAEAMIGWLWLHVVNGPI